MKKIVHSFTNSAPLLSSELPPLWLFLSNEVIFFCSKSFVPDNITPSSPTGAVRRIVRTAIVRTCSPSFSSAPVLPSFLTVSSATGPMAAYREQHMFVQLLQYGNKYMRWRRQFFKEDLINHKADDKDIPEQLLWGPRRFP